MGGDARQTASGDAGATRKDRGFMPGKVAKIGTFSDWIGLFDEWRKEIGVNRDEIAEFKFDTLYGAIETEEIQFGHFKSRRKWENLRQIPTQQMRDALLNMIVYQGDTECASVEQQRHLFETAPTDWDRRAITRVMIEEMRHGWQMCALLIEHFGYSGKVEAQKMLERRAFENKRLLGAFNVDVDNWMDFFTYTDFVDRDGKFQLQMLKYSAFAPLGRSMSYMLREEAFHMGTGNDGLRRIVEAGVIPAWLIQKYLNKWISSSYDLFGTDHSSSAHWAYVWGIKGRYDEPKNDRQADLDDLNDYNRHLYRDEVAGLIDRFNSVLKTGEPKLYAPDIKFNRAIGRWAGQKFHAKTGEPLDDKAYEQHLSEYMPSAEDKKLLLAFVVAKKTHALNAVGVFENGIIRTTPASELIYTMADPPNILGATQCLDMLGVMSLLQSGRVHLGFLGAAEVDRFGNLNSTEVRGPKGLVRLPGSGGACDIASLAQRFVVLLEHSKKRLPERVLYITSPGNGEGRGWRKRVGLPQGGPSAVITTKAVLRFAENGGAYF